VDNLKVCFVSHLYYPDGGGDVFGHHAIARALTKQGEQVDVITWAPHRKKGLIQKLDEIEITRLRGANLRPLPTIKEYPYLFGFRAALARASPDVVNCHSHLFLPTLQGIRASRSLGIPVAVTIHGMTAQRGYITNLAQRAYLLSICRAFLANADCVICLTEHDKNLVNHLGWGKRIEVIPNGVDLDLFHPSESKDRGTITWAGRMVPEKGLEHLLTAVSMAAREVPYLKLQLIGDGPEMQRLRTLAMTLGLGSNCAFLGLKSQGEVAKILARSSVFVLPSLSEGMPRALLEAMACANAIVASDLPQIVEVVQEGQTGFTCNPGDHQLFAKRLIECVTDDHLAQRVGLASRRLCEERFDLKNTAHEYRRVYRTLVENRPTRRPP
jgi:alpha-maltose-1-phosphate synthase